MAHAQHGGLGTSMPRKENISPQRTDNKEVNDESNTSLPNFPTYKKLKESLDFGKEYEQLLCAFYALKLCTDDDVVDFEMTTNNQKCGVFDDIELKVTFKNNEKRHYLIQLKHKENEKPIKINDLVKTDERTNKNKSSFCLWKYVDSIREIEFEDVICILYTNSATQLQNHMELTDVSGNYHLVAEEYTTEKYVDLLLNTKIKAQHEVVFYFETSNTKKKFYFFTQQNNIHVVKRMVEDLLKRVVDTDIYGSFIHFMKDWWTKNFVLTMHDFITKIVEIALSPYILTLSANKCNSKSDQLVKAIMNFEVTIVEVDDGIVDNIWSATEHKYNLDTAKRKFGMPYELSAEQKSKLLWHLNLVPMIVKTEDFNKLKPIIEFFRRSVGNKRLVLIGKVNKSDVANFSLFTNLSDLNDEYLSLRQCFNISLQGQKYIPFEQLLQLDTTLAAVIGTQELLKMTQEDFFFIGDAEKDLDFYHIPRTVTTKFVKTRHFLNQYKYSKDCLVIVNCNETKNEMLSDLALDKINLVDYLRDSDKEKYKNFVLMCTNTNCTSAQFEEVCEQSKMLEVYVLQIHDNDSSLVVMKKGDKLISGQQFHTVKQIKEDELLQQFESFLNVICAPPGMGKSRLLQSLKKKHGPSNLWLVYVELIKHKSFFEKFSKTDQDYETMLSYFLGVEDKQDFLSKIKKTFLRNKKILLFLDGLDEVDYKFMLMVLRFVKYVTAAGVKVWMSSRENLTSLILRHLFTVPIEIEEFTREDQREYLEERLKTKYELEKIENIVNAIFTSAEVTNSQKLLGIPLQLYIITETLLTSEEAYENINKENIFVLTKLYREFFNGKKKFSLEKLGMDQYEEQLGLNFEHHLKLYQIPALQACLDDADFKILKLKTKKVASFLVQIKKSGDKHGIIKDIMEENQAVFVHQTFAEYFACVWFSNHQEKLRWLRETFFSEKYQNLRLIFDVMMGENNPLHLAVIYKNVEQLDAHMDSFEITDEGERTCFHLVCCHGTNCPSSCNRLNRECGAYIEVFKKLLPKCNVFTVDTLFDFNCIDYAIESRSLFPLEKMLQEELVTSETVFKDRIDAKMMVYYACQFGYPNLLRIIIAKNPEIIHENFDDKSLLHVAILGTLDDTYLEQRQENIAVVKMLVENGHQLNNNILEFACQKGCYDMLEPLCSLGAQCSNGNTILHEITEYSEIKDSVLQTVRTLNIDIDSPNYDGKTALHIACDRGDLENIIKLLESGAKANVADDKNRTALHHAVRSRIKDNQIVNLLVEKGVDVNSRDENGGTALHDACFAGWFEGVTNLLQHGADPKIVDNYNETALFKTITHAKDSIKIIEHLVNNYGFDVNSQSQAKSTLLHNACRLGNVKIAKTLLHLGCDVNITDDFETNALHYAAEVGACTELIELLLKAGINVNAQNDDGETPLHLAINRDHLATIRTLLKHGASVGITDKNNATMLHYAAGALNENVEILNELIHANFEINAIDNNGKTPLHYACEKGILTHGKILCDNGADVKVMDFNNSTALHYAAQALSANEKLIKFLSESGLDVNAPNDKGQTPIHFACGKGPVENVLTLLDSGASIHTVDIDDNNVLHYAATNTGQNTETISLLIEQGININSTNKQGTTPLQLACRHYYPDAVELLYRKGADINCLDENEMNALHYAAQADKENRKVIQFLIDKKLNVNAEDLKGRTPLHFACLSQVTSNVHILIRRGANINAKDKNKMTLVHYANSSIWENVAVLNYLLNDLKLDANARNLENETPLHLAVKFGNYMNTELLLEHTDIEALCSHNSGSTILHYATMSENSEVLLEELLLQHFDVNACDVSGRSVLHAACQNSDYETVKLLIDRGAKIKSVDKEGRNALHYAVLAKKPDKELIKYLLKSGVEINPKNSLGSVPNYALEMECYGAVKILLETNVFREDDVNFLYYSVYSGYDTGVHLFYDQMDVNIVDLKNEVYPLYFAARDEQLIFDLLLKMTQFVDGVINYFSSSSIKYSHKLLVKYLENIFLSTSQITFSFRDVDDAYLFHRRCKAVQKFFQSNLGYDTNKD